MSPPVLDVAVLAEALRARLAGQFVGGSAPFVPDSIGAPGKVRIDSDGAAHPYAVVWGDAASSYGSALCATPTEYVWQPTITAAGGDPARCLRAVAAIRAAVLDWTPAIPGWSAGPMRELDTYFPGAPQIDDTVQPQRAYLPLIFITDLTPA